MSTLTKFLVVLVTILNIVFVSLVVPYVANRENLREQQEQAESKIASLEQKVALHQQELALQQDAFRRDLQAFAAQKDVVTAENNRLASQIDTALRDAATLKTENAELRANNTRLSSSVDQLSSINDEMAKQVRDQRSELLALQKQVIDLSDVLQQRDVEIRKQEQVLRLMKEQVVALEGQVKRNEDMLEGAPTVVKEYFAGGPRTGNGATVQASAPIEGTVTDVRQAQNLSVVQINLGKRDGVTEQMEFLVARGPEKAYVGTLVVSVVQDGSAAGQLTLTKPGMSVQVGDRVFSGIRQ